VGKALSLDEFRDVLREVVTKHRFGMTAEFGESRHIKYMTPTIDFRTLDVFHVEFRFLGDRRVFDFRESERSMYDRIMAWLNGSEEEETTSA